MDSIKDIIIKHKNDFESSINNITNTKDLEEIRVKYLGRNGIISSLMSQLKDLNTEDKRHMCPLLNQIKNDMQVAINSKIENFDRLKKEQENYKNINFDVTAYKSLFYSGTLHPYSHMLETLEDIFISMGYQVVFGPELETEYNNFDALNIAATHPARDMQDTFWLTLPGHLMRTHTSSVQIRTMKSQKPPIAIIAPGRTYRNEATDASHDFMFMQLEGLFISKDVSLSNLFATVQTFLQAIFKKDLKIKFRPSYFPFVEPGVEIDMSCPFCDKGCSVCNKTQWIEICGAGLVHPKVLQACNIDGTIYNGFAFGFGLTRLVMLKYGITDIRLLHSNKLDFLGQF